MHIPECAALLPGYATQKRLVRLTAQQTGDTVLSGKKGHLFSLYPNHTKTWGHMSGVFISYRRDDSPEAAGRLYDRLAAHFGKQQVFRDLDAIAPGTEFARVIAERIQNCDALVVIIGKDWLNAQDSNGKHRLDDLDDWVRTEIREALTQDKLVIPALVEGARMPKDSELPVEIAALAGCNAIEISESRFDYDTKRLLVALNGGPTPASFSRSVRYNWRWIAPVGLRAGVALALAVVLSGSASLHDWWTWIGDQDMQRTLSFLGGGLVAMAGAAWAVYVHFAKKPEKPTAAISVTASSGGVAVGGNAGPIATGAGAMAIDAKGATNLTINVTGKDAIEFYQRQLEQREAELAKAKAEGQQSREKVISLEKQVAVLDTKVTDKDAALRDYKERLLNADKGLNQVAAGVPADQLAQAQEALSKGRTDEAKRVFEQVLKTHKEAEVRPAEAAFRLGTLAYDEVNYATAYQYYLEATRLQPENAVYLNMAGRITQDMGRYQEALPFLGKALAIREKSLGPEHSDVATSLNNLAALYDTQGEYAKAEPLYQRSLKILEKSLGPEHPNVATALENYAVLLSKTGRTEEASRLAARAQAIRGKHEQANVAGNAKNSR